MEAILKFKLPEEDSKFRLALNGTKYYCAVEGVLALIRTKLKHGQLTPEQKEVLEEVRDHILEELSEDFS